MPVASSGPATLTSGPYVVVVVVIIVIVVTVEKEKKKKTIQKPKKRAFSLSGPAASTSGPYIVVVVVVIVIVVIVEKEKEKIKTVRKKTYQRPRQWQLHCLGLPHRRLGPTYSSLSSS